MKIVNSGTTAVTILLYPSGSVTLAASATSTALPLTSILPDRLVSLYTATNGKITIKVTQKEFDTILYNNPSIKFSGYATIDPYANTPADQIPGITVNAMADKNLAVGTLTTSLAATLTIPDGVTAGTNGWVYTSGAQPAGRTPTTAPTTGLTSTASNLGYGTMIFTFSGTDSNGNPYSGVQNVIVPAPTAITISAGGGPFSITTTSQALAPTYAGYTTGATYAWTQKSKPGGAPDVTFTAPTAASTTVNNMTTVGTYVVTVTVTNVYGSTYPIDVTITKTA